MAKYKYINELKENFLKWESCYLSLHFNSQEDMCILVNQTVQL